HQQGSEPRKNRRIAQRREIRLNDQTNSGNQRQNADVQERVQLEKDRKTVLPHNRRDRIVLVVTDYARISPIGQTLKGGHRVRDINRGTKKPGVSSRLSCSINGVDETRTRDLLRDRQAF